jgi:hypothetical protein
MANTEIFTNTYITGQGRRNYLDLNNSKHYLEDPLFTSFTFDIDYNTSPLFFTIDNNNYGYPDVEGMSTQIETALKKMYAQMYSSGDGYDILPTLSAFMENGDKMGFGIQQNVYMDKPLYGATEYIYMVDKRNGTSAQNDVSFDSSGNARSFKLGDSTKDIVSESDVIWYANRQAQAAAQAEECEKIMSEKAKEHSDNWVIVSDKQGALDEFGKCKITIINDDGSIEVKEDQTEEQISDLLEVYKVKNNEFERLKRDIISWANGVLQQYQNEGLKIYNNNKCVKDILSKTETEIKNEDEQEKIKTKHTNYAKLIYDGDDSFVNKMVALYNKVLTYSHSTDYFKGKSDDSESFLIDEESSDGHSTIRKKEVEKKFGDRIKTFFKDTENWRILVSFDKEPFEWILKIYSHLTKFCSSDAVGGSKDYGLQGIVKDIMCAVCDYDGSFEYFESEQVRRNRDNLEECEAALNTIRTGLYGDENGVPCNKYNASPNSPYGEYLAAKEKYENDDYSQAERTLQIAAAGDASLASMLQDYNEGDSDFDRDDYVLSENNDNSAILNTITPNAAPQTVLDMIGFIIGMKRMTQEYPYIIQGISGLDNAYKNHYGIKDPYLGSGDEKITLTCVESLDLRVSSMFNRYFNAIYDRQYRRERVPVNLRRFNCSIYVHDVRNFVSRKRDYKNSNRILELSDMYFSVIEFKFYDCEIVPEETGNIFNDISNEAPTEMKKTNFTFKYGNCVVNFVPPSEVESYMQNKESQD